MHVRNVKEFVLKLRSYLKSSVSSLLPSIKSEQKLSAENEEILKKAIADAKAI